MVNKNKKIVIIHPSLAPYRVDFFNKISEQSNCKIIFFRKKLDKFYNQKLLIKNINFKPVYLKKGFSLFSKEIKPDLLKLLIIEKPEIIISSEYGFGSIIALIYKKIFSKKKLKIFILTDENEHLFKRRNFVRLLFLKMCLNFSDGIIITNKKLNIKYFNKFNKISLPIIQNEIVFRENNKININLAKQILKKNKLKNFKILSYIGRLENEKNLFFLIKNFNNLKIKNLCLFIVGYGSNFKELKKLAKNKSHHNKIIFTGKLQGNKLSAIYNLTQILILPSTYEAFGAVVSEALISGCKVLVSNKVGAKFLINDKKKGRIFDINSSIDFNSKLKFLLNEVKPLRRIILKDNLLNIKFDKIINNLLKKIN